MLQSDHPSMLWWGDCGMCCVRVVSVCLAYVAQYRPCVQCGCYVLRSRVEGSCKHGTAPTAKSCRASHCVVPDAVRPSRRSSVPVMALRCPWRDRCCVPPWCLRCGRALAVGSGGADHSQHDPGVSGVGLERACESAVCPRGGRRRRQAPCRGRQPHRGHQTSPERSTRRQKPPGACRLSLWTKSYTVIV